MDGCITLFKDYSIDDKNEFKDNDLLDWIDILRERGYTDTDIIESIFEDKIKPLIEFEETVDSESIKTIDSESITELSNFLDEIKNDEGDYLAVFNGLMSKLDAYVPPVVEQKTDERSNPENTDLDKKEFPPVFEKMWTRFGTLFARYPDIRDHFLYTFKINFASQFFVNYSEKEILLDNPKLFNRYIFDYKIEQLELLSNYLHDIGKLKEQVPENLVEHGKLSEDGFKYYTSVIKAASQLFTPEYMDVVYDSFVKTDKKSKQMLNAFYAYLMVGSNGRMLNFDELVVFSFPKIVEVSGGQGFGNRDSRIYSIKFERGTTKPFGEDRMSEGEKSMGALAKLLLSSIPKVNSDGTIDGVLDLTQIISVFDKFKSNEVYQKASKDPELFLPIANLYDFPLASIIQLLQITTTRSVQTYQSVFNLSEGDRTVLRSLYRAIFDTSNPNSLINIEATKFRTSKAITSFSILSTVIGGLIRDETSPYTQTKYNSEKNQLVTEQINTTNTYNQIAQLNTRIGEDLLSSEDALRRRIRRHNLKFDTLPKDSTDFSKMANASVSFTILLSSGKQIKVVVNTKTDTVRADRIQLFYNDKKINFARSTTKNPNELNLSFPTSDQIMRYFSGDTGLKQELLTNEGLEIPLKILEVMSGLVPKLKLTGQNLNVLIHWMNTSEYDINPENKEIFFLNQISEIINNVGRNTLLQDMINVQSSKTESFSIPKFLQSFPGISNMQVRDYFDPSTTTLKLVWGKNTMGIQQLAKAYDETLRRVKKIVKDSEGNNLPKFRHYTVINHLIRYAQQAITDPNVLEKDGAFIKNSAPLSSNLLTTDENLLLLGNSYVYIDVTNETGDTKKVSDMNTDDLAYNNIVNLFLQNLVDSDAKEIYIQPVTFADKSTIVVIGIPKNKLRDHLGNKIDFATVSIETLKSEIKHYIGGYYEKLYNNILNDYIKIFSKLNETNEQLLLNWLRRAANVTINDDIHESIKSQLLARKNAAEQILKDYNTTKMLNCSSWNMNTFAGLFSVMNDFELSQIKDICDTNVEEVTINGTSRLLKKPIPFVNETHISKSPFTNVGIGFGKYSINYQIQYYHEVLFGNNIIEEYYKRNLVSYVKKLNRKQLLNISNSTIKQYVKKFDLSEWVDKSSGNLILGKTKEGGSILDPDLLTKDAIINPIYERYFYTHYLLQQSTKQIVAGSETAHPHKVNLEFGKDFNSTMTYMDLMIREESGRTTASFKRTVDEGVPGIIPIQGDVLGPTRFIRSAVINDLQASNYNIYGQTDDTDSQDGSSHMHPLYNLLLRLAQQDCAGGETLKLILRDQHSRYGGNVLYKYADFAMMNFRMRDSQLTNDVTDEMEFDEDGNPDYKFSSINFRQMFRKMSNIPFDQETDELDIVPEKAKIIVSEHKDGTVTQTPYEINLTKNLYQQSITPEDMSGGRPIYIKIKNKHYQLIKLDRLKDIPGNEDVDNKQYRAVYQEVVNYQGQVKIVKDSQRIVDTEINTIDQLFEVLGGVYSEDFIEGEFTFGNTSLYTLLNYVNNIGRTYDDSGRITYAYPTQQNTYQPLKTKFIATLTNASSVKVGASNVNHVSRFYDENPLSTMVVRTGTHIMVQDYDHIVTDGETNLSEFTQVITSVIQLGNSFNRAKQLFRALTGIAVGQMAEFTRNVNDVLENAQNKKNLYYYIGKLLIEQAKGNTRDEGLYKQLLINLEKEFLKAVESDDSFKLPFSDPQIFRNSVIAIISAINSLSIKRKFPGGGLIMVPAYGFVKHMDIPGQPARFFSDLTKWLYNAEQRGNIWSSSYDYGSSKISIQYDETTNQLSNIQINERQKEGEIPQQELLESQDLRYLRVSEATQLYRILASIKAQIGDAKFKDINIDSLNGNLKRNVQIILDSLNSGEDKNLTEINEKDIVNFKKFIKDQEHRLYETGQIELKDVTDIDLGSAIVILDKEGNLKSVVIDSLKKLQKYSDPEKYKGFYIDHSQSRNLLPTNIKFTDLKSGKRVSIYNDDVIRKAINILSTNKNLTKAQISQLRGFIDDELHLIHGNGKKQYYTTLATINYNESTGSYELTRISKSEIKEGSIEVSDYEARIPKIFKQEFGLKEGDSLGDILEQGYKFFLNRSREKYMPRLLSGYDVCFTKQDGKHDYITFKKAKNVQEIQIDSMYIEEDGDYKYVVDNNGNHLYARYKKRYDTEGNVVTQTITDKDGNTKEIPIWDDYIVPIIAPGGVSENLYYIAYGSELEEELENTTDKERKKIIRDLIQKRKSEAVSSLYSIQYNEGMYINPKIAKGRKPYLIGMFNQLANDNIYIRRNHSQLMNQLNDDEVSLTETISEINESFQMSESKARSIFNSFRKSLELIVARIPAQSMQSFMKMKVVGFLDTDKNEIQVSHFQTWIQGSDYDIDKAYTMALTFKKNGELWQWSPFASTADRRDFERSLKIPVPSGKFVERSKSSKVNVSDIIDRILQNWDKDESGKLLPTTGN